jgi:hypothetical protein
VAGGPILSALKIKDVAASFSPLTTYYVQNVQQQQQQQQQQLDEELEQPPHSNSHSESCPATMNLPATRFLSSPKARDITAAFAPLTTYAAKKVDLNCVAQWKEDDGIEEVDEVDTPPPCSVVRSKIESSRRKEGIVATTASLQSSSLSVVKVNVTDLGSEFSSFQESRSPTPDREPTVIKSKRRGRPRTQQPNRAESRPGTSTSTSSTSPTQFRAFTRSPHSPSRSPTFDIAAFDNNNLRPIGGQPVPVQVPLSVPVPVSVSVPGGQHAPKAPESRSGGGGGRPATGGIRLKTEGAVQVSQTEEVQPESGDINPLEENSASTMFSIMITMPEADRKPPELKHRHKDDTASLVEAEKNGVSLAVSDSFVEQNITRAMNGLTHRPIKRVSPRLDPPLPHETDIAPHDDRPPGSSTESSVHTKEKELPDEILSIVGNVSPRLLATEEVEGVDRPNIMPVPQHQHQHHGLQQASHHTSQQHHQQQQHKQRNLPKQTLMLSLPSAVLTKQESKTFLVDNSARFEKPLKRNLSADSFSEFNLSVMSMSVADSLAGHHGKGSHVEKPKSSVSATRKYLEHPNKTKSSTVYLSKLKSEVGNFVVKYPVQGKG